MMFVPAWAWKAAPYIGGLLLAVVAYAWAYDNGRDTEREKWQRQAAIEAQKVRERENELQRQVDIAGAALSEKQGQIDMLLAQGRTETRTFYVQNPSANVACLTADRLRHIQASDAALEAASAAK